MNGVLELEPQAGLQAEQQNEFSLALDRVRQLDNPTAQYAAFLTYDNPHNYGRPLQQPAEFTATHFDQLIDFAASPDSSDSLLVRAQALDYADDQIFRAISTDPAQAQRNGLLDCREAFNKLVPAAALAKTGTPKLFEFQYRASYTHIVDKLIRSEGLDEGVIYQDYMEYDHDFFYEIPNNIPVVGFMLLEQLRNGRLSVEEMEGSELGAKLLPLVDGLGKATGNRQTRTLDVAIESHQTASSTITDRLSPLFHFGDEGEQLGDQALANASDNLPWVNTHTAEVLADLYKLAGQVKEIFPDRYQLGVEQGIKLLLARSVSALGMNQLVELSQLDKVDLPLGDNPTAISLRIPTSKVTSMLWDLKHALTNLHEDATTCPVVPVVRGKDFQIYRFARPEGSRSSVYIRPYGSHVYDRQLEYGRPGEGVEASISFSTDIGRQSYERGLSGIGRHRPTDPDRLAPDRRLSIRLDREGVLPANRGTQGVQRDPTQREGTLSLDVGSVLGREDWPGTRIGRLLAAGDHLYSLPQGGRGNLNHVTRYFDPEHGLSEVFATEAEDLSRQFAGRRLTKGRLLTHYSGRQAVQRSLKA